MAFSEQEYGSVLHSLLQWIFPTQGLNLGPLHRRQILYHLSHQGGLGTERWSYKGETSKVRPFLMLIIHVW